MWFTIITALMWCAPGGQADELPEPPRIVDFPENDLNKPGEVTQKTGLKIPCGAKGSGLKWEWKWNGLPTEAIDPKGTNYKIDKKTGTLIKTNVGGGDDGTFQCFVKNSVGATFSRKLKVKVTAIGYFDDCSDKTIDVTLGRPTTLVCPPRNADGFGAVYQWRKFFSGAQVTFDPNDRRVMTPEGNMYIINVTSEDVQSIRLVGGFQCRISAANVYDDSCSVNVREVGKAPSGPVSPSFYGNMPATAIAVEGHNLTLTCIASGRPIPTIKWKKRSKAGGPDEVVAIDNNDPNSPFKSFSFGRTLVLHKAKKSEHEGIYTCEAQSSGGTITQETSVTIHVPPFWSPKKPPEKMTIDIEGDGTLVCSASGDPDPVVTWYKDGVALSRQDPKIDNNKLHFKNIKKADAGVYQCAVENAAGMQVGSSWIYVKAKKPTFNGLGPFYLFRGTNSKLRCNPDAAPLPTAVWTRNGDEIKNEGRYVLTDDGRTLTIQDVKESDKGAYTCRATNDEGWDSATGQAIVLDRTQITVPPRDVDIVEGRPFDLRCEAKKDKTLELMYKWEKDGAELRYNSRVVWRPGAYTLTVFDARTDDAGRYTCIAYTPEPRKSQDSASAIVSIRGAPDPPTGVQITPCVAFKTELSWTPSAANNASITHYIVEQADASDPNVFVFLKNVTDPSATKTDLKLTPWADLMFRMKAVNKLGTSRPSDRTTRSCVTEKAAPSKYPDNLRGVPKKAEELDIVWDPLTRLEQNAPGCRYLLSYGKSKNSLGSPVTISDPSVGRYPVPNAGYYQMWYFKIQAVNDVGPGPESPTQSSYSGQDAPKTKPTDVGLVGEPGARSITLRWNRVTVDRGSVDGYRIYFWSDSQMRKRRAIGANANFTDVKDTGSGRQQSGTVTGLTPFTHYKLAIVAFNSGGEGPQSDELSFKTLEAVPGPPDNVQVYPFGKYILLTWSAPVEKNGIITGYEVGASKYDNIQDLEKVRRVERGPDQFRNLFKDLDFNTKYAVEVAAKTSVGAGKEVRELTTTIGAAVPAKPRAPEVDADSTDSVVVTFLFGLEKGGYPEEFKVYYREKAPGMDWLETGWVNHFDTQTKSIEDLKESVLYEFKTKARNSVGESEESDTTDARAQPGIVSGARQDEPITKAPWFIVLLVVIVLLLLVLVILVLLSRRGRSRYPVGKREKGRSAILDEEPDEEEGIPYSRPEDIPPNYQSQASLHKSNPSDSDRDSLDDYGEGPEFKEDGSFTREYGDDKDDIKSPDQKDQSALATFV